MPTMQETLDQRFADVFAVATETYARRGFQARVGFGERPALVHIDLANAWTQPESPFCCDNVEAILDVVNELNAVAREKSIPIIFVTTAYESPYETGYWIGKIPALTFLKSGSRWVDIDERIAPQEGEKIVVKKRASAFPRTELEGYLREMAIDTVILTGVTASCCVRHTAEDAIAIGFRPIVVREAVGDRIPGAVTYNLFDIDAKFADVVSKEEVLAYLRGIAPHP